MKKLLSVLLVVSTLFLTLNFQICFAKCDNYSSQNYEDNQKDVEIQKLKELLKEAENRNEKIEKEKQEKEKDAKILELEKLLKDVTYNNEKLKSKNSKPSLWSRIKSNFSFFFSSYIATGLAAVSFGAILFGIYCVALAGHSCYNDKGCKIWGSEKDRNFLSKLKEVDKSKPLGKIMELVLKSMGNSHIIKVVDENNGKQNN